MILIPLFGVIILNLVFAGSDRMRKVAFWFALALFVLQVAVAAFHHQALCGNSLDCVDTFFKTSFFVDHLTFIMFICIGMVSIASLFVARYTMPDDKGRFKFINWHSPARPIAVRPTKVTTGTPIQKLSRLVVWPLHGKLSRPTSTR